MKMRLAVKTVIGIGLGLISLNSYSGICTMSYYTGSCGFYDSETAREACYARQSECLDKCMERNYPGSSPGSGSSYNYGYPTIPPSPPHGSDKKQTTYQEKIEKDCFSSSTNSQDCASTLKEECHDTNTCLKLFGTIAELCQAGNQLACSSLEGLSQALRSKKNPP